MTIQTTLFLGAVFALAAAGIYAFVGWRLSRRVVPSPDSRLAWTSFIVWWYGLAATTSISAVLNLLAFAGITDLPLFLTASYVNLLVLCIALWGLLYYLIYLFTGNPRWFTPLSMFYAAYYVLLVYFVTSSVPEAIDVQPWIIRLSYRESMTGPFFLLLVMLLVLPQIIGGLAYFSLYFRISEPTQRYRVLLVSWSIIIWFLSPIIALAGGVSQRDWWQLVSRFIGLAAAMTILTAYLPPRWVRRRYGILSLSDESLGQ